MQCPACGQTCAPTARFCGNCGAALTPPAQAPYPPVQYGYPAPPPKKTSPWVWIGTGAGLLVLLVIVVAVTLSKPEPAPAVTGSTSPAQKTQQPAQKSANSYFVGKWRCFSFGGGSCPVGWEDLQIRADGTYTLAGKSNGTWKMDGEKAVFAGPLAFAGPAEKYQNDQFQFNYVDSKSGFGTYIIFVHY
jgi:hypothetical protein